MREPRVVGRDLSLRNMKITLATLTVPLSFVSLAGSLAAEAQPGPGSRWDAAAGPARGLHRGKLNFRGEMIDAQEAYRIGVANRVVPADRLMAEARALADKLLTKA
ncbi:MAG: enoyl-CoA hydratase/isomerase family protein [Candidatus Rokuibacteriota bacterium]